MYTPYFYLFHIVLLGFLAPGPELSCTMADKQPSAGSDAGPSKPLTSKQRFSAQMKGTLLGAVPRTAAGLPSRREDRCGTSFAVLRTNAFASFPIFGCLL